MIVVAEAVAAIAAAIAIRLMSRARFGRPLVGMVVNVTFGTSCVIRGDCRGCVGYTSSAGMRSGLCWMTGTSPGVLFLVCRQCTRHLYKVYLGRCVLS
jgi:hypothetical protein